MSPRANDQIDEVVVRKAPIFLGLDTSAADIAQAIAMNRKFVVKALLDERATASQERQVEIDETLFYIKNDCEGV